MKASAAVESLSLREARRVAIAAQGLAAPRPAGKVTLAHVRRVLDQLQLVQIDSVNVLARAHHLAFFARLGPYDPALVDRELFERQHAFEYWAHAACIIPVDQYAQFRPLMAAHHRWERTRGHLEDTHPGYLDRVLAEIGQRGPMTVGDLEDPGERTGPWWGWGKGKLALEAHFAAGTLTTRARRNFARVYDLPERVLPAAVMAQPPLSAAEAAVGMLRRAARAHGIATLADLANYYHRPLAEARAALPELLAEGTVRPVRVEGWREDAYLHRDARLPRRVSARALVSPFDSLVWAPRGRSERLFDFQYTIELYTPEPKRVYGYYVLPFLLGDRLVGRVDLKADRQAGVLIARGAFAEDGVDHSAVAGPLAEELRLMASWLGLNDIRVEPNGDLATPLARAI